MDHTHIVQASDLERYADTIESQSVVPELLYLLVKQSISIVPVRRIPYGDAINQQGWDGIVESEEPFLEYIPKGKSYWEIGTGRDPKKKANQVFTQRTTDLEGDDMALSTFIFVTPRCSGPDGWIEPEQTKWIDARKDSGWKEIRIIDSIKLADWLREFPAIGRWMAKKMGMTGTLGGISTPREHWENIVELGVSSSDPPIPPELFTEGRSNACNALQKLFDGESKRLVLFAEGFHDVDDFVAGYLETLDENVQNHANRCLYIGEKDAWRSVVEVRKSHVLVANPRLGLDSEEQADLQTYATRNGHAVVIPLCGAFSGESHEIIRLQSPSRTQIENILRNAGYSEIRVRELAGIGGDRLSALRRHLRGLGDLPSYATWNNVRLMAQVALAGQWRGDNKADRAAMEQLLGKEYGEWIETLRSDALRSDSPLIQRDEKWRYVARGEVWSALGSRITDDDLDRFKDTALTVLGERDPKFDLLKEDRFAAPLHNKQLEHSSLLRQGLAETLALAGSRPEVLTSCSINKAENTVVLTVHRLLKNAAWDRWASLDSLLPLLAEAAPEEFLGAVESALEDLARSPFHEVFAQEGDGVTGGWNYMSGLLWALETLAWHPDFLSRVAVILADLASIDPGGRWSNRPSNSLVEIFLPWHVQTSATLNRRKIAVETVLEEQPEVGWKLVLDLLPRSHGSASGCHRPTWRDYIHRDWQDGVLMAEYWEQINIYTKMAVRLAKTNNTKLGELIDRLSDLPESAKDSILDHLVSEDIITLPEAERMQLWERLDDIVRKHRKGMSVNAKWALPEDSIAKIERVAKNIVPKSPELKYQPLFSGRDYDLIDVAGEYEEQIKRLNKNRQDAVQTIIDTGGLSAVLTFAQRVAAPYEVGRALGVIGNDEVEKEILPTFLNAETETVSRIVSGFVWERFYNLSWSWADRVLQNDWDNSQKGAFLALLPFAPDVWSRVNDHLGQENESHYWLTVVVNPYGPYRDLSLAIEKLIEFDRISEAVRCLSRTVGEENSFKDDLAIRALLAAQKTSGIGERLDPNQTIEVIKQLQKSPNADSSALFKIEWYFLPWLAHPTSPEPPLTLEKQLASVPSFFAKVIALVFRSRDEKESRSEPTEERKASAENAYGLLSAWSICPGKLPDDSFDPDLFKSWLNEAIRLTKQTGHEEIAQYQIGNVLIHAPADPDGLWIHKTVASVLNTRNMGEMRSGFTSGLYNQRGAHMFTAGEEERDLARLNYKKAEALNEKGYTRFAAAMREFAKRYEQQAQREARRQPFED